MFEWDETKRQANLATHGVDFADITRFDLTTAVTRLDSRTDYGEDRLVSFGLIGTRLHVLAWTRRGGAVRIISLRKANPREVRAYGQETS